MNNLVKYLWKKELMGELYTWKSILWLVIASLLFSFTTYLLLTNKELSLLDQTELMWLLSKVIVGVAVLMITIDASSIITTEFENGTAESLFLTPISTKNFVLGKFLSTLTLWCLLFVVSLPYIIVTSIGSHLMLAFILYTALLGTLTIVGFAAFIFAVSLIYRSTKDTLTTSLMTLVVLITPALFSTTLKNNSVLQIFSKINPIDNVFSALDNILVDYKTAISNNWQFILPLCIFCTLMLGFMTFAIKKFNKQGIIKND